MFTRGYGGFLSHGATPSSQNQLLFIRFLKSDFPWNQPSKYLGTPIYGNPHNYIIYIFILYIIYYICIYYMFTRGYGGFLSHGATPSSQNQLLFIRFLKSDFPWNQPSKYLGTPIYGNPHNYIIYIFILCIIYIYWYHNYRNQKGLGDMLTLGWSPWDSVGSWWSISACKEIGDSQKGAGK